MTQQASLEARLPQVFGAGTNVRPVVARRYLLEAKLGEGEFGAVYAARDLLAGTDVAIKLSVHAATLEHEFLVGRTLQHPNVVRVLAAGPCEGGLAFLAMELLRGVPLDEMVDQHGRQALAEVALGAARALRYVHERGYVHGDLKPANIWVSRDGARLVTRVLDFGLASEGTGHTRGTLAYLAPELLDGGAQGARSDLFALGVSLYEAATGTSPFLAATTSETCRRLREEDPPEPMGLAPGLRGILRRLMARDPDLRLPSAAALVEALLELPELAGRGDDADAAPALPDGPLVGRAALVQRGTALVAERSGGGVLLLTGATGSGRTRLLDELAARAQLLGAPALPIRTEGGTRPPVPALVHGLAVLFPEAWHRAATRRAGALPAWAVAPHTTPWAPGEHVPALVLAEVVAEVLAGQRLLVTWDDVDKLHADDEALLRLILPSLCGHRAALVVARTRGAEGLVDTLRSVATRFDEAVLEPLEAEDTSRLVDGLLGPTSERHALHDLLHAASRGNPGTLRAVVQRALRAGDLQRHEGRVAASSALLGRPASSLVPASLDVGDVDGAGLTDAERDVMLVASLLVEPFRREQLQRACETCDLPDPSLVLAALVRAQHVETSDEGYRLVDRALRFGLRFAALEQLAPAAVATLAREGLAARADATLECAELLALAGARDEAVAHVSRAARAARERGRPALALDLFRWALERAADPPDAAALHEEAGDVALALGAFAQARDHLEAALALASGDRAALIRKLGWTWAAQGDYRQAVPTLGEALQVAVEEHAPRDVRQAAHFALGWALMMAGSYAEAEQHALSGFQCGPREGAGVAALHRLVGTIRWHRGDGPGAAEAFRAGLEAARKAGDAEGASDCEMGLGTALRVAGDLDGAAGAYERAIAANRGLGRLIPVAKCLNGLGIVRYLQGRWDEAIQAWEAYRDACVPIGDRAELVLAFNNLGFLYSDRGEYERAVRTLERGLELVRDTGFQRAEAMLLGNLGETRLRLGELEAARRTLEASRDLAVRLGAEDERLEAERRLALLRLREGEPDEAHEAAEAVFEAAAAAGNTGEQAQARFVQALAALEDEALDAAEELLEEAEAGFRAAGDRLGLLRVRLARASARARVEPDEALETCREVRQAALELGAGSLVMDADGIAREADRHAARPLDERSLRALSLAAEFSRILDLERLLVAITDSAIELTQAERGMLILFSTGAEPVVHAARGVDEVTRAAVSLPPFRVSRSVADRVYREGLSLAVTDIEADEELASQQSIMEMRLRSVLCVPMTAGDERLGILYVDSRAHKAKLGTEALAVLGALAALAATAIVNARQFEAERRKQRLMSSMMHELRTPLTGFKGFLDLLVPELTEAQEDLAEMADALRGQVGRLARLTEETRRLDRIIGRADAFTPGAFSLADVVRSVAGSVRPLAAARHHALAVDLPADLPAALGAADWVSQVLTNLIGNAVSYTPEGGNIEVSARFLAAEPEVAARPTEVGWSPGRSEQDGVIMVRVHDDGPGVPAAEAERIFDWYHRGSVGVDAGKGSGIGLALAREIVHVHGGAIGVERSPMGGAAFWFTLPAVDLSDDDGEG